MRHRGFTLIEILLTVVFASMLLSAVLTLVMQSARVYSRHASHAEKQSAQTVALAGMQRDFREALAVTRTNDTAWVTLSVPLKAGADHVNDFTVTDGVPVVAVDAAPVHYFLGTPTVKAVNHAGTVLYRAKGDPVNGVFPAAHPVLSDLTSASIFDCTDPTFVRVTLTSQVKENTGHGIQTVDHTTSANFYLRNRTP